MLPYCICFLSLPPKKQGNQCGRYAGLSDPSNIDRHGEAFRPSTVSIPMGIVGGKRASMGDPWGSPVTVVFAPAEAYVGHGDGALM